MSLLLTLGLSLVAQPASADPGGEPDDAAGSVPSRTSSRIAAEAASGAISRVRPPGRPAPDGMALEVTIDRLTPAVVPRRGRVLVTGTVTNVDSETWTAINLYSFIGSAPMTTAAELTAAAATDPLAPVGDRITTVDTFDTVDRLEPGQSAPYSLRVPRSALDDSNGVAGDRAGVYFFGVHALGQRDAGRDLLADGRARTFLPLVPRGLPGRVRTAVVAPLRHALEYAADGSLDGLAQWAQTLSVGGRLRSLIDFGTEAGSRPLTWLVDPALPDAVRRLAAGNPPRSLAPTVEAEEPGPAEEPSPSPSGEESAPPGDTVQEPPDRVTAAAAGAAQGWLDRLQQALAGHEVLALPYGDLDVTAAARHDPSLYVRARERSGTTLEEWEVASRPAVGPPRGYLDAATIGMLPGDTTVLVTDRMFTDNPPDVADAGGHRLVVASSGAASGGPGPGDRMRAVDVRQRILADAAVRLLTPGRGALVVVLPSDWTPTSTLNFFGGLTQPWLRLTTVAEIAQRRGARIDAADLDYPERQAQLELDAPLLASVEGLVRQGEALQNVLARNDRVAQVVTDQALSTASYAARRAPRAARRELQRSTAWIRDKLRSVQISAPRGVTMSSDSGTFSATVTNGLDQPVTVGVVAEADSGIRVSRPEPVTVGPNSRTTLLFDARATAAGVHDVTLLVTDADGAPLGPSQRLSIRSAQVSEVIWLILGGGAGLLLIAISVRLLRRIRDARAEAPAGGGPHQPGHPPGHPPGHESDQGPASPAAPPAAPQPAGQQARSVESA